LLPIPTTSLRYLGTTAAW